MELKQSRGPKTGHWHQKIKNNINSLIEFKAKIQNWEPVGRMHMQIVQNIY